jgi:hypothetical protein
VKKSSPKFWATSTFKDPPKLCKQSPNGRNFAQSGRRAAAADFRVNFFADFQKEEGDEVKEKEKKER